MAYKLKKCGDYRTRRSFSKSKNTMELSDLLEVQKKSYQKFLEEGIREVFDELFPVESFTGNVTIDFGDYSFDEPLKEGDYVVFEDMALYTMVKNNTFNGMPLPAIVRRDVEGNFRVVKSFGYEDFRCRLS